MKRTGVESEKSLSDLAKKSEEIIEELDEQQERLEHLIDWSESTEKQIEDLLPGATSTALASASSTRANKMARNKFYWFLGFIGSAIGLGVMITFFFSVDVSGTANNLYIYISKRVAITAILIVLMRFFSNNYSRTAKLEEIYAFKVVATHAFEGYKKQMKEMDTDSELANKEHSLTRELAILNLDILAKDPSKVYEKGQISEDVPLVTNKMLRKFKETNEDE